MDTKTPAALRFLLALSAVSFAGEILVHRHAYFALESTPFFFVFYGLIGLTICLTVGRLLAAFVSRPLDYYDEDIRGEDHHD